MSVLPYSLCQINDSYNPYEEFNSGKKVLTYSNGQYDEVFNTDSIEIIESVIFNVRTRKVIGFIPDSLINKNIEESYRFLSIDPSFAVQPHEGVYNFAGNSPILYVDYQGNFKWPGTAEEQKALENKYPKFTKIMQNIHKMPDMYENLIDEMSKNSGVSKETIIKSLQYGQGATIQPILAENDGGQGAWNPNTSTINISEAVLDKFESLEGDDLDYATTSLGITLLHEEVHRGDRITNNGKLSGQWNYKKYEDGKWIFVKDSQSTLDLGKQANSRSLYGHRGSDLEVAVFGAKAQRYTDKMGTAPISGFSAGFSMTIDQWDNIMIKVSEQNALREGLGDDRVKQTAKKLQE